MSDLYANSSRQVTERSFMKRFYIYFASIFLSLTLLFSVVTRAQDFDVTILETKKEAPLSVEPKAEKELLAARLGDIDASAAIKISFPALDEAFEDREIFAEYGVTGLVERQYGQYKVEIFVARKPVQAYGLYSFYRNPSSLKTDFGNEGDIDDSGSIVRFWQGSRYVQVSKVQKTGAVEKQLQQLAKAISSEITKLEEKENAQLTLEDIENAKSLPSVIAHLPQTDLKARTVRYILGKKAFSRITGLDGEKFDFYPNFGTEVAFADYATDKNQGHLLIFEYHTPQQSINAYGKLVKEREGLSQQDLAKSIIKREGNYIIEAYDFTEMLLAEQLVASIKYDYVVKWIDYSKPSSSFSSEATKTAQMLISVFSIIGIGLLAALSGGTVLGCTIFLVRRRRAGQNPGFSDAGGMVRLNLDEVMLSESGKKLLKSGE